MIIQPLSTSAHGYIIGLFQLCNRTNCPARTWSTLHEGMPGACSWTMSNFITWTVQLESCEANDEQERKGLFLILMVNRTIVTASKQMGWYCRLDDDVSTEDGVLAFATYQWFLMDSKHETNAYRVPTTPKYNTFNIFQYLYRRIGIHWMAQYQFTLVY